jgi:hypothetical protein
LYASPTTAGAFTNVRPTAPNNVVPVAAVLSASATVGEIIVRPVIEQDRYYGVFSKTDTQTPAAANTAYPLVLTTPQASNGVSLGTPASRVTVVQAGLYQFDVTVQVTSASASVKTVWVWFRKNGTDIANSARIVSVDINAGYTPVSISRTISMNASDYVEVVFAADSTAVSAGSIAATAFAPGAPAVMLSVAQVQL